MLARAPEHAGTIGAGPYIHTLRAIAVFEHEPTVANALGVVKVCGLMPRDDTKLSQEIGRLSHNLPLVNAAGASGFRKGVDYSGMLLPASTFSDLRDVLRNMITQKVLPGITTVGSEQPGAT